MRARAVAMAAVLLAAAAANASGNFGASRPSPGGALPLGNCRGSNSSGGGGVQRLRGGFEAVMPLKPGNLGKPNAWSGQNLGELTPTRQGECRWQPRPAPASLLLSAWCLLRCAPLCCGLQSAVQRCAPCIEP